MANPQVGHLDELQYLRPAIKKVVEPDTKEELDVTWMPMNWTANVADPSSPTGARRVVLRQAASVVMPTREEERRYTEDRPCLNCKHFNYTEGQKMIQRDPDAQVMIGKVIASSQEFDNSIGIQEYGICELGAEGGGEKACSPMAHCEAWTPRRGGWKFFSRSREYLSKIRSKLKK
jgi:hypothetical protein